MAVSNNLVRWPCELTMPTQACLLSIAKLFERSGKIGDDLNLELTQGVFYFLRGTAIVSAFNPDLEQAFSTVMGRDNWCGATNIIGQHHDLKLQAEQLEPVTAVIFPKKELMQLLPRHDELYKWLLHVFVEYQPVYVQASLTSLHSMEVRVVSALLEVALRQMEESSQEISLKVTQQQLALIAGLNRSNVNKALKVVERSGELSLQRGAIVLHNVGALKRRLHGMNNMFRDLQTLL